MTVKSVQDYSIFTEKLNNEYPLDTIIETDNWVRNPCWLALPEVSNTEQKIVSLVAVDEYSTHIAFTVTMANFTTSQYTVDWGDGIVENFTSGVTAYHRYDYANTALANTDGPVTFDSTNDIVSRTNHGYTNGMKIKFAKINTTTGIVANKIYYVINATANNFQVSATSGGSAIDLVSDGTGSILPYKQAILTITSTRDITAVNLSNRHNLYAATNIVETAYLDMAISLPLLTTISMWSTAGTVRHSRLERINVLNLGYCTGLAYFCRDMYNLQKVVNFNLPKTVTDITQIFFACVRLKYLGLCPLDTSYVTNFTQMFSSCYSLETAPVLDTRRGTTFTSMFNACYVLKKIPQYDLSSATTIASMFYNCFALKDIPPLLTTEVLNNTSNLFYGCCALEKAPFINTKRVNVFTGMFQGCYRLQEVPLYDTSSALTITSMFNGCYTLRKIPKFDFSKVTTADSLFTACYVLDDLPELDFSSAIITNSMFFNCNSLRKIKAKFKQKLTVVSSMFYQCFALEEIPQDIDFSRSISFSNLFAGCRSLTKVPEIDASSCVSMVSMFESCYVIEKVSVKNTTKVTAMNTMFQNCWRLRYIPNMDTSNVTTMANFAAYAYSLEYVPRFNLQSCTTMVNMFYACWNLKYLGGFDNTGLVTDMRTMFFQNYSLRVVPTINANGVASATNLTAFPDLNSCYDMNLANTKYTFSIVNAKLSANALNKIYTSLPTVVGQTITVTGNWGTATDNTAIATAKGWTVTG